jgi:hypothetical protein
MFLSVLSASVIALFFGLTTYIRLVAVNHDETRWVLGMNRIRAAYLELAPELERWFITSHHDDERGLVSPEVGAPSQPFSAMSRPRPRWGSSTPWSLA